MQNHSTKIEPDFWYTDKQIASRYNSGRSTLWAWVAKGEFPAPVKIGPRTTRWSGADLLKWEDSLRNNQVA